jgi:CMP-N,N'-diacetyllegionaminic acid synthase
MIADKSVLAVVPARGGSKGIPLKNLRQIRGRSLVQRVGEVLKEVPEVDRAVVSTDHPAIAAAATSSGIAAPFQRPAELSGDVVSDFDVLAHALQETEAIDGRSYDVIVMLQPTSVLRSAFEVSATIKRLVEGRWDSVWTVSATDSKAHPLKQLRVSGGALEYYDPAGAAVVARQQLEPVYHRNGVAYALTRDCLVDQRSIMGSKAGALVLERTHISIDTEWDFALAEFVSDIEAARSDTRG